MPLSSSARLLPASGCGRHPLHRGFPPSRSADVLHHWTSCGGVRRLSAGWSSTPLARLRIPTLQVFATTSAELPRGWLVGPLSEAELSQRLGIWLPARRFGIRQGTSVRAIDDYSFVGHNAATSIGEMVDMGTWTLWLTLQGLCS